MGVKSYSLGQVGDYEIKQLKVFKAVVDCGGFSAAETVLNVGRSTISSHISNLETRLNLVLCRRGRSGFSLTEEGQIIYEMTNSLLESLESFRTTVNNLNVSLTGKLRIALSDTISLDSRSHFPELIKRFSQQAPEVSMTTNVASMENIERMIFNDEVDIGFIPYHRKLEGLDYVHLYHDDCFLYCVKNHELAAAKEDELAEKINTYPATHADLKHHEKMSEQISKLNLVATSYFYDSRLALILSGQYIGFLPKLYAQPYIDQDRIVAIATSTRNYTLGVAVICKKTSQPNKPRELFLKVLSQTVKELDVAPY